MKLPDFNTEELIQMKQACIDTRAKYDGLVFFKRPKDTGWCPLCEFDSHYGIGNCNSCPWIVVEEGHCSTFHSFFKQRVYVRRKRLDRWIKLIDEEILKHSMRSSEAQIGIKPNFE